ncbi:MAG TPA: ABC transporter permease [Gammaproteobacteria bacterium]|nr:ABC transporter permease [Gammaproteobacteria bacterium]
MNKNRIAFQTILFKEITRFMRIWTQTLLPPAITMTLYFIIFGKLIGSQIRDINGYTYMQYIVPGLTLMSVITNAYANTSSSFFGAKFTRSVEEMLVSSMPDYIILLGFTIGGALRGILVGVIVTLIALFFTHLHFAHPGMMIMMVILSAMLFSVAGLINGIFAKKFDDVSFIPTFVLTPLTYLGGIFYSVSQLPPFWQTLSTFNPILNMVDTYKYAMLGVTDINVTLGFSLTLTLFLVLFAWCLLLLHRGTGHRT